MAMAIYILARFNCELKKSVIIDYSFHLIRFKTRMSKTDSLLSFTQIA